MEKFVKFDDPSCGLNPFMPLDNKAAKELSKALNILRHIGKVILILLRVPCLIITLLMLASCHLWKYLLFVPKLVRLAERLFDYVIMKFFMQTCSFNTVKESYHKDHPKFDFIKWQRNQLEVEHETGDLLICNQTSFIDFVYLMCNFSPIFTKIVILDSKHGSSKAGLRVMGTWETIWTALGIKMPEIRENFKADSDVFFSVKKLRENYGWLPCRNYADTPIVIFPEGTKTNGQGVIDIENDIISIIVQAAIPENLKVHTIRFDHTFTYFSAYNTTDQLGLKTFFSTISQFTSKYNVQYYHNISKGLKECKSHDE